MITLGLGAIAAYQLYNRYSYNEAVNGVLSFIKAIPGKIGALPGAISQSSLANAAASAFNLTSLWALLRYELKTEIFWPENKLLFLATLPYNMWFKLANELAQPGIGTLEDAAIQLKIAALGKDPARDAVKNAVSEALKTVPVPTTPEMLKGIILVLTAQTLINASSELLHSVFSNIVDTFENKKYLDFHSQFWEDKKRAKAAELSGQKFDNSGLAAFKKYVSNEVRPDEAEMYDVRTKAINLMYEEYEKHRTIIKSKHWYWGNWPFTAGCAKTADAVVYTVLASPFYNIPALFMFIAKVGNAAVNDFFKPLALPFLSAGLTAFLSYTAIDFKFSGTLLKTAIDGVASIPKAVDKLLANIHLNLGLGEDDSLDASAIANTTQLYNVKPTQTVHLDLVIPASSAHKIEPAHTHDRALDDNAAEHDPALIASPSSELVAV